MLWLNLPYLWRLNCGVAESSLAVEVIEVGAKAEPSLCVEVISCCG